MPESPDEISSLIENARALREKFALDPHRPGYHFVVPEGVHAPVDPNGALFWNGRYHMHYIYQHHGMHYWGHVSSTDMLHWRQHPPSLSPGDGDDGIFSGGAFVDRNGVATISYWGLGNPGGICIATSTDPDLDVWVKSPHNPVIRETSSGLVEVPSTDGGAPQVYGAADPSQIWWKDGHYHMLTGNLLVLREYGEKRGMPEHLGDTLYLFDSDDIIHWTYRHEFYESKREWTKEFEDDMCPDFFALPSGPGGEPATDKHMILFISHTLGCQYYIGDYTNDRFTPETHGRMTWVDNEFFAPESLTDDRGRRIMWAWVFDRRENEDKVASGWSGELSLPRELWHADDGTLRMRPVEELNALTYGRHDIGGMVIGKDETVAIPDVAGRSIELAIDIEPGSAPQCGVTVCRSPDGEEATVITYDSVAGALTVDTTRSSLGKAPKTIESAPLTLGTGEILRLRIFVDKSFVEVFVNDRQAVVRRVYPTRSDSVGVSVFARNGAARVLRMSGWQMMQSNAW